MDTDNSGVKSGVEGGCRLEAVNREQKGTYVILSTSFLKNKMPVQKTLTNEHKIY